MSDNYMIEKHLEEVAQNQSSLVDLCKAMVAMVSKIPTDDDLAAQAEKSRNDLRDYFAGLAMQGLLAQSNGTAVGSTPDIGAIFAYTMADAMLKAREENHEP
jgi:DNA-binding FadR family transcriptional regulator